MKLGKKVINSTWYKHWDAMSKKVRSKVSGEVFFNIQEKIDLRLEQIVDNEIFNHVYYHGEMYP